MVRRFSVIELLSMSARDPSEAESFVYAKDYDAAQARIRELEGDLEIAKLQLDAAYRRGAELEAAVLSPSVCVTILARR